MHLHPRASSHSPKPRACTTPAARPGGPPDPAAQAAQLVACALDGGPDALPCCHHQVLKEACLLLTVLTVGAWQQGEGREESATDECADSRAGAADSTQLEQRDMQALNTQGNMP